MHFLVHVRILTVGVRDVEERDEFTMRFYAYSDLSIFFLLRALP